MRFEETEVQRALREAVRSFAAAEIAPIAGECDREGTFPDGVLTEMAGMGLTGLTVPESYGGEGGSLVELVVARVVRAGELFGDCAIRFPRPGDTPERVVSPCRTPRHGTLCRTLEDELCANTRHANS